MADGADARAGDEGGWHDADDSAFVVVDRDWSIVYADHGALELYERDGDVVGAPAPEVLGASWLGDDAALALRTLRDASVWSTDTEHRTTAGLQRVRVRASAWRDGRGGMGGLELRVRPLAGTASSGRTGTDGVDLAVEQILATRARQHARSLQRIVAQLIAATTLEDVGSIVCGGAVAALDAFGGHVAVCDGVHRARFVCSVGYPEEVVREWGTIDLSVDTPIRTALVDGRATWLHSRADRDECFPALRAVDIDTSAVCAVPIQLSRQPFGCLGLSFGTERAFDMEERSFLHAVANAAALAIDRILAGLGRLPAPAHAGTRRVQLLWDEGTAVELSFARRTVRDLLAGEPAWVVEHAVLCTSELLTNAVRHGRPPVRLRVELLTDTVLIDVDDGAHDAPARLRPVGDDGGRGLHIVDAISSRWGTTSWPWGKTTWAEVGRTTA